jgi:hypothetical protein
LLREKLASVLGHEEAVWRTPTPVNRPGLVAEAHPGARASCCPAPGTSTRGRRDRFRGPRDG